MSKLLDLTILDEEQVPSEPLPFGESIDRFLQEYCEIQDGPQMATWRTLLQQPESSVRPSLYIIQEDIGEDNARQVFCHECRLSGWSNNFVSRQRFHFIIPADSKWNGEVDLDFMNVKTHALHGLIHSNGFGHLLCLNGIEGGSNHLHGKELMDLWDHLCSRLYARAISINDLSKKGSMHLRLLYAIAYKHPWFGKWNYKVLRGTYGVTVSEYNQAAGYLSSMEIDELLKGVDDDESDVVKRRIFPYKRWAKSSLETIGQVFNYLLTVKSPFTTQNQIAASSPKTIDSLIDEETQEKWKQRIPKTAAKIVEILIKKKAEGQGRLSGTYLKSEAKSDSGLIDHILSRIDNVKVGAHVVKRAAKADKHRSYEYFIYDQDEVVDVGAALKTDITFLFDALVTKSESQNLKPAVQTVLRCKQLVKTWPFNNEDTEQQLMFTCQVEADLQDSQVKTYEGVARRCEEHVILPRDAGWNGLMVEAEEVIRSIYCVRANFAVTEMEDIDEVWDYSRFQFRSGGRFIIRARGLNHDTEGGPGYWKVACLCGVKDDDGENFVSCSKCKVKQHMRCNDLKGPEPAFLCEKCTPASTGGCLVIDEMM